MVNKVELIGWVGSAPEPKEAKTGPMCTFSMSTVESWKDKATGKKKRSTTWHDILAFGGVATICLDFLEKGTFVYVEGRLAKNVWTDPSGVTRVRSQVIAKQVTKLLSKNDVTTDKNLFDGEQIDDEPLGVGVTETTS